MHSHFYVVYVAFFNDLMPDIVEIVYNAIMYRFVCIAFRYNQAFMVFKYSQNCLT